MAFELIPGVLLIPQVFSSLSLSVFPCIIFRMLNIFLPRGRVKGSNESNDIVGVDNVGLISTSRMRIWLIFVSGYSGSGSGSGRGKEAPRNNSGITPKGERARSFTFRELATATRGFKEVNLLGEGGFGRVYKGRLETGEVKLDCIAFCLSVYHGHVIILG